MKKLAVILCMSALATGAYAQGLVNFFNNTTTLVSDRGTATPNVAGQYYFGLLTAPVGSTDIGAFTFAGVYGTNQPASGRFTGGLGRVVDGWAPGTSRNFLVAGWSVDMGATFNPVWLTGAFPGAGASSVFGLSEIGTGIAGGGPQSLPNLNIFGAAPSINQGFNLIAVPEPSTFALAGLGAAAMLIFRRRK